VQKGKTTGANGCEGVKLASHTCIKQGRRWHVLEGEKEVLRTGLLIPAPWLVCRDQGQPTEKVLRRGQAIILVSSSTRDKVKEIEEGENLDLRGLEI